MPDPLTFSAWLMWHAPYLGLCVIGALAAAWAAFKILEGE